MKQICDLSKNPPKECPSKPSGGKMANCLKRMKEKCRCILTEKGDSCYKKIARRQCNFKGSKKQKRQQQVRATSKYRSFCRKIIMKKKKARTAAFGADIKAEMKKNETESAEEVWG